MWGWQEPVQVKSSLDRPCLRVLCRTGDRHAAEQEIRWVGWRLSYRAAGGSSMAGQPVHSLGFGCSHHASPCPFLTASSPIGVDVVTL